MANKNQPSSLHCLVNKWIEKDELTNAIWEIQTQNDLETVQVSGTLKVNMGDLVIVLKVWSITHDDEDSIGRALQALNEKLFKVLQKIQ